MNIQDILTENYSEENGIGFVIIADTILNNTIIRSANRKYRICEIEFYLKSDTHPDSYTHCNVDQLKQCTFYFHKFANGSLKNGTFKGMDIVLGHDNIYFGILIRSIYNLDTDQFIEGPCNCVNEIIKNKSLKEFIGNRVEFNCLTEKYLSIESYDLPLLDIFFGNRIGLSDKYPEYKNRPYRFLTMMNKIKKGKKSMELLISYKN